MFKPLSAESVISNAALHDVAQALMVCKYVFVFHRVPKCHQQYEANLLNHPQTHFEARVTKYKS